MRLITNILSIQMSFLSVNCHVANNVVFIKREKFLSATLFYSVSRQKTCNKKKFYLFPFILVLQIFIRWLIKDKQSTRDCVK